MALYANGQKVGEQTGDKVFRFKLPLNGQVELKAVAGDCIDQAAIRKVDTPNPAYKLKKGKMCIRDRWTGAWPEKTDAAGPGPGQRHSCNVSLNCSTAPLEKQAPISGRIFPENHKK